ncbi:MAG: C25 family cysteine peptidase, partial [Bacteroidales bacterium]|nr:C25 family cysteine peptidase [Bacteroidales bacterium]
VKVTDAQFTDFNIEVAPSKGNISRQIDPETVAYTYGEMYSQNAFYPTEQAYLEAPYIIRDFRGQNIMVTPFAYNPVTKTLRVFTSMTITMTKLSDNGENPKLARKSNAIKVSPEMKNAYSRRFINFGMQTAKYTFTEDQGEMLVICPEQYMEAMQPFVDWKNISGRPTTMVSVAQAGGNNDNNIKAFIQDLYENKNLEFILFVGDYADITPHNMNGGRSDNWFAMLEGNDYYLEAFVGRFSVESVHDVETHVNKVLYYERDMPSSVTWADHGLGIGAIGAGYGHFGEDDYQHIDLIRDTLLHYTYTNVTDLHQGAGASANSISAAVNDGVSIINYCNHGSETSWGVANYSNSHVNALTNDYMWPMVISVACLNGKFNHSQPCFGETWLRATNNQDESIPTGAVGGMFSWISQPWIPPQYGQDEMIDILTEWHSADLYNHTMGGCFLNGDEYILDASPEDQGDTHNTWILFGDPSMMVRTTNPTEMNVTLSPSTLLIDMSELDITVDADYAIATLSMDGEVLASTKIVGGNGTLTFAPLTNVGNANLVILGYNKVTYNEEIEVIPADGAFVTVSSYMPTFAAVNQETSLSMSFKNVGNDPTSGNTEVVLTCDDERLQLINSTATLDVMQGNEIVDLNDAFSFIIAEGV